MEVGACRRAACLTGGGAAQRERRGVTCGAGAVTRTSGNTSGSWAVGSWAAAVWPRWRRQTAAQKRSYFGLVVGFEGNTRVGKGGPSPRLLRPSKI